MSHLYPSSHPPLAVLFSSFKIDGHADIQIEGQGQTGETWAHRAWQDENNARRDNSRPKQDKAGQDKTRQAK